MFRSDMNGENVEYLGKDSNDPLFAPISDIESIFADDNSPVSVLEPTAWHPKPIQDTMHSFIMFDLNPFVGKSLSSLSYQAVPDRIPNDENLSIVLDELDDITQDLRPEEIAAVSAETCLAPLLTPFVPAPLNFKHLNPCPKTKRRVVSDESSSEKQPVLNPEVKRQRVGKDVDESDDSGVKFRLYQAEKWHVKFEELLQYKRIHGHCQVPHGYKQNPTLARWAKRQRYQYKLFQENKPSTMTEERISDLENLGFVWDSHTALWDERYNELKEYVQATGSANVPSTYPPNPKLAIWVKCQRRQYKLLVAGQPSNMTHARVELLNKLNFIWEIRRTGYLS